MRWISFLGILAIIGFSWLVSLERKKVRWRIVLWGLGLQLLFALFIFVIPAGSRLFIFVNQMVVSILDSASAGTQFLFGRLALPPGSVNSAGESSIGYFLVFQALPTIVFFAALVAILYYAGIMNRIIQGFSYVFTSLMRISGAESCVAASNIFVGVEASLVVRPYLEKMTRSEINTILTCGMATIASSMLSVYTFILKPTFPMIAGHLVSASIMNAPAAIVISKLLCPETGAPETLGKNVRPGYDKEPNLFAAIINGANSGVKLIAGIMALLLAFLGLVELLNKMIGFAGNPANSLLGINMEWSLKGLLGYLFYPFTFLIGVPWQDVPEIARIIGERIVLTEVASFQDLALLMQSGTAVEQRSIVIATYALTGFAHVASMAIFVGGVSALVPQRVKDISQMGFLALLGATLANLLTGAVAGLFYSSATILIRQVP